MAPYRIGARHWISRRDGAQSLLAVVSEVSDHELVLTDVRVSPDGPVVLERLIVGRAVVSEAREYDEPAQKQPPPVPPLDGRRVTVKG